MNKKKLMALCLIVCLLAIAVVGGSLAYFTDKDAVENTFTTGNVAIDLTEAVVEKVEDKNVDNYGDLVPVDAVNQRKDVNDDSMADVYDYGKLYPGQNIYKDPTIENTGDELAYVAAKIIVTDGAGDINALIGVPGYDNLDITQIAKGGLISEASTQVTGWNGLSMVYETATCVIYQEASKADSEYVFYIFIKKAMDPGASVTLFDTLFINEKWDNAEMDNLKELSIKVEAYATQEYGFKDCFTAITTAFDTAFNF